jgi:hypothetical protein
MLSNDVRKFLTLAAYDYIEYDRLRRCILSALSCGCAPLQMSVR